MLPNALAPAEVPVIVTVSEPALVVRVMPVPAAKFNVSVVLSATTFDCPATATVWNPLTAPLPALSAAGAHAEPFHFSTSPVLGPVVATLLKSDSSAAAILASALVLVKYKLVFSVIKEVFN